MRRPLTITLDASTRESGRKNIISTMNSIVSEVKVLAKGKDEGADMAVDAA